MYTGRTLVLSSNPKRSIVQTGNRHTADKTVIDQRRFLLSRARSDEKGRQRRQHACILTERLEQELDGLALVPHDRRPDLQDFPALSELQLGEVPEHGLDLVSQ